MVQRRKPEIDDQKSQPVIQQRTLGSNFVNFEQWGGDYYGEYGPLKFILAGENGGDTTESYGALGPGDTWSGQITTYVTPNALFPTETLVAFEANAESGVFVDADIYLSLTGSAMPDYLLGEFDIAYPLASGESIEGRFFDDDGFLTTDFSIGGPTVSARALYDANDGYNFTGAQSQISDIPFSAGSLNFNFSVKVRDNQIYSADAILRRDWKLLRPQEKV